MKQTLLNNLKNLPGARINRKIVVFSVDDYGNVRLDSKKALENLKQNNIHPNGRFDELDTLETTQDLEQLYEVLTSVKDKTGRNAAFTPYALPCNIDFEATQEKREFVPETLHKTWKRLKNEQPKAYENIDKLWQEGMDNKIFIPQFHGREHLNINLFNKSYAAGEAAVIQNLKYKSLIALPSRKDLPNVGFTQAFAFWDKSEIESHKEIIKDGLQKFREVYGFDTTVFTPPAQQLHPELYAYIETLGVQAIDKPLYTNRHLGTGNYKKEFNKLGRSSGQNHITIVRNVVFEPTNGNIDHVGKALKQVEAAFRWNKPANISSHRVNYCGHIDPQNRRLGLAALKELLQRIVKKWPDVEFMGVDEMVRVVEGRWVVMR